MYEILSSYNIQQKKLEKKSQYELTLVGQNNKTIRQKKKIMVM